jgi:hypothetical protein
VVEEKHTQLNVAELVEQKVVEEKHTQLNVAELVEPNVA